MEEEKEYLSYSDFIKDENFVKWRFTGDERLEAYWNGFLEAHPELVEPFEEACSYFENFKIQKETLSESPKEQLLNLIKQDISKIKQKKKRRIIIQYVAAACIVFVLGIVYKTKDFYQEDRTFIASIEAEKLSSEDIYLITPSGAVPFKNDIEIQIGEDNSVLVQEKGASGKSIYKTKDDQLNKLIVPHGKRSQLELADGTKVWLNSGSTLEFPSQFSKDKRQINLTGELYIDVAKDKTPFIVQTEGFDVQVYGTKFNVSAYEGFQQTIVLEEGSIGVKSLDGSESVLKPKELLVFENNNQYYKKSDIDVSLYTSWKSGYLIFNNTPIQVVLEQIGRYYNLSFNCDNQLELKNRYCTGKIFLSNDIDNVLTTLAILSSGEYQIDGDKIYINIKH